MADEQDGARSALEADRGLFTISVAAEVTGVSPQMLRVYEQRGLLSPCRTPGGTRRYSRRDLNRATEIASLLDAGLNLVGVGHVLVLRADNEGLHRRVDALQAQIDDRRDGRR